METGERWRLGHRPALDGLRGVAVLLVLATHFDTGQFTLAGVMGVKLFFALSGFLITTLLLEEQAKSGRISLRRFYERRALRLFPALAVMVAAVGTMALAGWPLDVRPGMVAAVAGYVSNWYLIGHTHAGVVPWGAIGHTWSLAIEEQFYLLWPLVVVFMARRGWRTVFTVATVGAVASLAWGLASGRSALATDVSAWCLLVGCALAAWQHGHGCSTVRRWWLAPLGVVALLPLTTQENNAALVSVAHVVTPLVAALVIWVVVNGGADRWLRARWLTWIGRRSYGLYLWHVPVSTLHVAGPWLLVTAGQVAVSFGLTVLSWRFVEQPCLRLKERATGIPSPDSIPAPTATAATLAA